MQKTGNRSCLDKEAVRGGSSRPAHPMNLPDRAKLLQRNSLNNKNHLELQTTSSLWLFQLDDSKSLHGKWLELTVSIH